MPDPLNMKTEHAADKAQEQWSLVPRALHFNIMCGDKVLYEGVTSESQGVILCDHHNASIAAEREKLAAAQAAISDLLNTSTEIGTGVVSESHVKARINAVNMDTAALDAAIEQKRLEIWRDAPNQPDIQEAVIKKLDLVHRHAVAAAQQPLVDALKEIERDSNGWEKSIAAAVLAKVKEYTLPDGRTK